jgi:hypothetical protein
MVRRITIAAGALLALLLAGIIIAILMTSPPAHAACQPVGCWQECYWVDPGHRRCRERCRMRCWNDAPRYYPPAPQPQYYPPAYQEAGPIVPPELIGLGILAIIIAVIGAIVSAVNISTASDIAAFEEATRAAEKAALSHRAEAREHDARITAITEHIAAEERKAFEQGQRDADEEWRRLTRE